MKRVLAIICWIGIVAALSATRLHSQSQSDLLSQLGAPAGTTTWPFPGGFINLQNGNINISIPVETLKERNGTNLTVKYVYDSKFWTQVPMGIDSYKLWVPTDSGEVLGNNWEWAGYSGWKIVISPSNAVNGQSTGLVYTEVDWTCDPIVANPGTALFYQNYPMITRSDWKYIDSNGTAHSLNAAETIEGHPVDSYNGCTTAEKSQGMAGDGSGYFLVVTGYQWGTVYDVHGNIVYTELPGGPVESIDTNGNFIPYGNLLDELGRRVVPPNGFSVSTNNIQVGTDFGFEPGTLDYDGPLDVLTGITLQNGRQYSFTYDEGLHGHYGVMTSMTLPTGGTISFQLAPSTIGVLQPGTQQITTITTPDGATTFNWSQGPTCTNPSYPTLFYNSVLITTPNQAQTTYTYCTCPEGTNCSTSESTLSTYAGTATGTPLKTVTTQFDGSARVFNSQTTLDNGQSESTAYTYYYDPHSTLTVPIVNSLVGSKKEYDFSGALVRETDATYMGIPGTQYGSQYTYDLPDSVQLYGPGGKSSGTLLAETDYTYDATTISATSGSLGTALSGPIVGHDSTYGTTVINYLGKAAQRGNLTGVYQMVAPGQYIWSKTNYYNILGELIQSVDGNGHSTYYDYTDNWADSSCITGATYAYPTTVTNELRQFSKSTYNTCDGSVHSVLDPNGKTTTYGYDNMQRLISTTYPDGGQTATNYGDPSIPEVITTTTLAAPSPSQISSKTLDGLGRTVQTTASSGAITTTSYNTMGWVASVSNPSYSTPSAYTTYTYDALGRKLFQYHPDGAYLQWACSGTTTTSTDENGHSTTGTTDALGRLWKVVEPGGLTTIYWYDALNNLIKVNQQGNGSSDVARIRSFSYDGLSRLLTAANPETGSVNYTYDNNGNVLYKTDARLVTITYNYDILNRISSKSYSDGTTPLSCYQYDSSSVANGIGRLTNAWTQSASTTSCSTSVAPWTKRSILAYDPMGRILNEQQCTPSNCTNGAPYSPIYSYDLAGNLLTSTSGVGPTPTSPITFTNTFDSSGRLHTLSSNWYNGSTSFPTTPFPTQLFSSPSYAAFGGLTGAMIGSGLTLTRQYDANRLWLTSETDTGIGTTPATPGSATVIISGTEQSQ